MLATGTVVQNRYRILRQIGGGGMGVVYLAEDTRLPGRRCAIKEMSPAQLAPQDRRWAINAFRQEAQMLANLSHPGLTAVTDFFPEGGNWYLVMDYVEGETLEKRLERARKGRLPLEETLGIIRQLCNVLEYLHGQSPPVVFRDLKPGNVMLTPQNEVKLIDFGIARFFKPGQTRDTVNLGTPGYAAPELYGGLGQSDPRTDVYSLGALLLQMVTGYDPITAVTPFPLPPVGSLMQGLPAHMQEVISRATQLQPDLRYPSVRELRQALFPRGQTLQKPGGMGTSPHVLPSAAVPSSLHRWLWIGLGTAGILLTTGLCIGVILLPGLFGGPETATPLPASMWTPSTTTTPPPLPSPTATPPLPPSLTTGLSADTPFPVTKSSSMAEREVALLRTLRYREGNDGVIFAYQVEALPTIDGRLDEWSGHVYDISYEAYDPGAGELRGNLSGPSDLYGRFYIGWDADNLHLGIEITDDVHVQIEGGRYLYKGDDVEIQIDANLSGDFYDSSLSSDDGQVGLSAGDFSSREPEAYIWRPPDLEQAGTMIVLAARETSSGYTLEAAIPWWTLGGRPPVETPVGFCLSLSDNDVPGTAQQQTLISTAPTRKWGDPTAWGTLILVDWR